MEIDETVLSLQFSPEAQREIAAFTQRLALLPEKTAQGFFDKFLGLLDGACLEFSVANGAATPSTSNYVIRLRIDGFRELCAAAAGAGECKA